MATTVQQAFALRQSQQQSQINQEAIRAKLNQMITQKNIQNKEEYEKQMAEYQRKQVEYQKQLQTYISEMQKQGFTQVIINGELKGFDSPADKYGNRQRVPLENIDKYIESLNAKTDAYNKMQEALAQSKGYGTVRPTEIGAGLTYDINKMIEVEKAYREKNLQKLGLATPLINILTATGERTLSFLGPTVYAVQHPIQTYEAIKAQISPGLAEVEKRSEGKLTKAIPLLAAGAVVVGGTYAWNTVRNRFELLKVNPEQAIGYTIADIAPFMIGGPKVTKSTIVVRDVKDITRFRSVINELPEGKFLVRTIATTGLEGDNIALMRAIGKQFGEGKSLGLGKTINLQRVGPDAVEITISREVSIGRQVGAGRLAKEIPIVTSTDDILNNMLIGQKTLKEGKGVITESMSQDIGKFLYQERTPIPGMTISKVTKQVVEKKVEKHFVAGFTKPRIPKREFQVGEAVVTMEGQALDNVLDFLGTTERKIRVYKKGGISYVGRPNIFGEIIIGPEVSDPLRELLIGSGKQETSAIQKIAMKQAALAAKTAKVRQVSEIVKTVDPIAAMENALVGTTKVISQTRQQQIQTPSAAVSNLLVETPRQQITQIERQAQPERQAVVPYVRQFAKVDTTERLAELLVPRLSQKLRQEERQRERLRQLQEFRQPQRERLRQIPRIPRIPQPRWTLTPTTKKKKKFIKQGVRRVEKRRKGKYAARPTETQLIYGLRLPRGLNLQGGFSGFEIARV
jgi:hypothetical protein